MINRFQEIANFRLFPLTPILKFQSVQVMQMRLSVQMILQ